MTFLVILYSCFSFAGNPSEKKDVANLLLPPVNEAKSPALSREEIFNKYRWNSGLTLASAYRNFLPGIIFGHQKYFDVEYQTSLSSSSGSEGLYTYIFQRVWSLGVVKRFYLRSSFNIKTGLRYLSMDMEFQDQNGRNQIIWRTYGFLFGIGNRWYSESGWFFGVDYLSYFFPVSENTYDSNTVSGSGTRPNDRVYEYRYGKNIQLFNVSLGKAF